MAIELKESITIDAPVDDVWRFLLSPVDLAGCMPGAEVTEILDEEQFKGSVKMRVGAISVKYVGLVKYAHVDADQHSVTMKLEAGDTSGGTVGGSITTTLSAVSDASTNAEVRSSIDLTGRLVQIGRGMIDGVSRQVISTFIKNVREHFAQAERTGPGSMETTEADRKHGPQDQAALNLTAFVWRAFVSWFASLPGRIMGRHRD